VDNFAKYYWADPYLGGTFSGAQIARNVNDTTVAGALGVKVDTDTTTGADFGQWKSGGSQFSTDINTAVGLINAQVQSGVTDAFHLTNNRALVDQIAFDIATQHGTASSHYVIGTADNTNSSDYLAANRGFTNGFINLPSDLRTADSNASDPNEFLDQCVALVKALDANVGLASTWTHDVQVYSGGVVQNFAPGTPIATFTGASYNSNHAAFFLTTGVENGQAGFFVLDQYNTGSPLSPDGSQLDTFHYEPAEIRFISVQSAAISQYYSVVETGGAGSQSVADAAWLIPH
jgi:hypothetical protein